MRRFVVRTMKLKPTKKNIVGGNALRSSCKIRAPTRRSESKLALQSRRTRLPLVPLQAEVVAVVEESPHVERVKLLFLLVLELELGTDVRQVEIEPVALRRQVDPVEIAETLRMEQ